MGFFTPKVCATSCECRAVGCDCELFATLEEDPLNSCRILINGGIRCGDEILPANEYNIWASFHSNNASFTDYRLHARATITSVLNQLVNFELESGRTYTLAVYQLPSDITGTEVTGLVCSEQTLESAGDSYTQTGPCDLVFCESPINSGTCECISGGPFPDGTSVAANLNVTIPGGTFAGTYLLTCDLAESFAPNVKSVSFTVGVELLLITIQFFTIGGFARVLVGFGNGLAAVNYRYFWLPPDYIDGCGNRSPQCADLTQLPPIFAGSDAGDWLDYEPSVVRIGTL